MFDRLSARFGDENIFMDVDDLDPGVDFVEALEKAVSACDVLLVLIEIQWLEVEDEDGRRRLDNPEDFVHIEVAAALDCEVRVIPFGTRRPYASFKGFAISTQKTLSFKRSQYPP